jgi:hypothetical protein
MFYSLFSYRSQYLKVSENSTAIMMKTTTVLMAIIASMFIYSTQAQVACFKHYTRGEACTSGKDKFTGIALGTTTEDYNNPLFYSKAAAAKSCSSSNPAKGRFSGKLPITSFKGPMTFDFFAGKDQIKITFEKATGKGTITGGKGCYTGIKGTATRKMLAEVPVKYFEWTFCPKVAPSCTPK